MGTDDDEVKPENSLSELVSTTASWISLILLTVDLRQYVGQSAGKRLSFEELLIKLMGGLDFFHLEFKLLWAMNGPIMIIWAPEVGLVIDFLCV